VSCVKTAEPIKMQFVMVSRVGLAREHVLHGDIDDPREGTLLGVSG